jgi:hypothetical protein
MYLCLELVWHNTSLHLTHLSFPQVLLLALELQVLLRLKALLDRSRLLLSQLI